MQQNAPKSGSAGLDTRKLWTLPHYTYFRLACTCAIGLSTVALLAGL